LDDLLFFRVLSKPATNSHEAVWGLSDAFTFEELIVRANGHASLLQCLSDKVLRDIVLLSDRGKRAAFSVKIEGFLKNSMLVE
jgi:hypothetical protein